jgi:osmoprotectant transport system permease protein
MRPDDGSMRRLIILSVVVLPHPDGPTNTQTSPSSISRLSSCTTVRLLYCLLTDSSRSIAARGYSRPVPGSAVLAVFHEPWVRWDWIGRHTQLILSALWQHVVLTGIAVGVGLLIAAPLALLIRRWRVMQGPVLSLTGVLYTIPSLALLALLVPLTGLTRTTAEIALVSYTLLILIRNIVAGLDGVPSDVLEAAEGMGYSRTTQLARVELPLALPVIMAGVRIAVVTTIGLVTVTALIGQGGLGKLINDGLNLGFRTEIVVGSVLSIALATFADLSLVTVQRLATPWTRARARA